MADSIAAIGSAGIHNGYANAARHAQEIVSAYQTGGDTLTPTIELKNDARQVQASAAIVKVADKLNGAILDIVA